MKKNRIILLICFIFIFIVIGIFISGMVKKSKSRDSSSKNMGIENISNNVDNSTKIASVKNNKIMGPENVLRNDKTILNNIVDNGNFSVEKNNSNLNIVNSGINSIANDVNKERSKNIHNEKDDFIIKNKVTDSKVKLSTQKRVNLNKNIKNKQAELNNSNSIQNVLPSLPVQTDKNNELVSQLKSKESSKTSLPKTNTEETKKNDNIEAGKAIKTTYEDGERKITTLWVKGIKPVKFNTFNKERFNNYLMVTTGYQANNGWYDVNKNANGISDRVLCSGAVASNILHWWIEQNKNYIDRYLRENPSRAVLPGENSVWKNLNHYISSYNNQHDSKIFEMFKLYYGNTKGIWADTSVDFFINGYKPSLSGATNRPERFVRDNRGGFFYEVFGKNTLTKRFFSGDYDDFSDAIKSELQSGNIMGLSHRTPSKKANHIITLWGADFDEKGKIIGVYVSDSDDYNEPEVGMRRLNVNNKDGKPVITSSIKKNIGINLEYVHSLSLGTDKWEKFFK